MYRTIGHLLVSSFVLVSALTSLAQEVPTYPEVVGQEVEVDGGTFTLPATLDFPAAENPVPCVVMMAGSGPTDRNWNSAMVPGGVGSALLLADALRQEGIGSIRYDKAGSGVNTIAMDGLTIQHFADEGIAAYRHLSANPACDRIFMLGNSEGGLHVLQVGVQLQGESDWGGVITLSGMARSMLDTLTEQVRAGAELEGYPADQIDAGLAVLRTALEGLPDTATNPPDFSVFPDLQVLFEMLAASTVGEFELLRGLLFTDPAEVASGYSGPALVVSATHDVQIPISDGDIIFAALADVGQVRRQLTIENSNHVYREETRSVSDVDPTALMLAYWEEDRPLAPGLVEAIVAFVREVAP